MLEKRYKYNIFLGQKSCILLIILLFLSGLMGYKRADTSNIVYIFLYACFALYTLFLLKPKHAVKTTFYDIGIFAFIAIIYLSFIPGLLWGGQSIYYSFRGAFGLLYVPIFLYIFLQKSSYSEKSIKNCLVVIFLIYIIVYIYSLLIFPDIKFSQNTNDADLIIGDFESRGVMRLFIPFEDLITLGILYFVNNPIKNWKINISVLVGLIILTFLRGTRSLMLMTIIFAGLLFLKQIKRNKTVKVIELLLICVCVVVVFLSSGLSSILDSYIDVLEKDSSKGSDYIRWVMADYYLFNYNSSVFEYIFGHGIPISGNFQRELINNSEMGFYPDDIGYVELFLNFGILGIVVLVLMLVSVIITKVNPKCYYAKYYIYYLFLASFFGRYILSNMALFAIMLYVVKISTQKNETHKYSKAQAIIANKPEMVMDKNDVDNSVQTF